jgi:hypothetical protein
MRESTDHILDAIDHAIGDYDTSGDAMRWTPRTEPPTANARVESRAVLDRPYGIRLGADIASDGGLVVAMVFDHAVAFALFAEHARTGGLSHASLAGACARAQRALTDVGAHLTCPDGRDEVIARARARRGTGPPVQPFLATGRRRRR